MIVLHLIVYQYLSSGMGSQPSVPTVVHALVKARGNVIEPIDEEQMAIWQPGMHTCCSSFLLSGWRLQRGDPWDLRRAELIKK